MEIHTPIYFSHLTFLSFFLLSSFLFEIHGSNTTDPQAYIVHVQKPKHTKFLTFRDRRNWYMSFLPNTTLDSGEPRMIYTYRYAISGFAAMLTPDELQTLKSKQGVVSAHPDHECKLRTTYSPKFLGLSRWSGLWPDSDYGAGQIIGMMDSGIKYSHPSFDDQQMSPPPPPSIWKGKCYWSQGGCNKKIIGAVGFHRGQLVSPLDTEGHGTTTASIAAGNIVDDANVVGYAKGTASGLAPGAHLAVYKVTPGTSTDLLKGIDQAIHDQVHVLSMSIGYSKPRKLYRDAVAVGSFAAVTKGIVPVEAGGNAGPLPNMVDGAPWILMVGSSVMDRRVRSIVELGDGREFYGESAYQPDKFPPTQFPLIYPYGILKSEDSKKCQGDSLNLIDVREKIVLCEASLDFTKNVEVSDLVKKAGGVAVIVMNQPGMGNRTDADAFLHPASRVTYNDTVDIIKYVDQASNPTAAIKFNGTQFGYRPAPVVSSFSNRGPNLFNGNIIKPDFIAPGSDILAAWPTEVGPNPTGTDKTFIMVSGTSMAAPHVSGIVALLKHNHRHWSPAAIKSAIMTTAYTKDRDGNPIKDQYDGTDAGAFTMGSGHVDPVAANDPGLIYDNDPHDYIRYLCGMKLPDSEVSTIAGSPIVCSQVQAIEPEQLNYPSISVSLGAKSVSKTVNRTVTNVGDANSVYTVKVDNPEGVDVDVSPITLTFTNEGEKQDFTVTKEGKLSEGQLVWDSGKYFVRSPIAVTFT
ncbi:subtilisin-like protease SBT1.7 [Asparagus officinalis]|uniref:subtilisin-like protease SBT1.7 n=1 Tax=Asparagus officinalis TaxID=4686 RepID=UPI00098E068E|nr:subtilisin-like protease SBT1.7 [Asparagus officinalis]